MTSEQSASRSRLLAGLPVEEQRMDIAGVTTSVLLGGEGPPLVLLHGGIQSGGAVWWRVIPRLARTHRLIIPDLPGLGESSAFDSFEAEAVVGWLAALIHKTTDQPPVLVAHSLLGVFATRYALEHGSQIRTLVLVDAPGLGPFRPRPSLVLALVPTMLRPSPGTLGRLMRQVVSNLDQVREQESGRWEAFMAYLAERAALPRVKATMRQLPKGNLAAIPEADLERIEVPVALIWGDDDRNTRLGTAQAAAGRYGWPLHVIPGGGHIPHVGQPGRFLDALDSVAGET